MISHNMTMADWCAHNAPPINYQKYAHAVGIYSCNIGITNKNTKLAK